VAGRPSRDSDPVWRGKKEKRVARTKTLTHLFGSSFELTLETRFLYSVDAGGRRRGRRRGKGSGVVRHSGTLSIRGARGKDRGGRGGRGGGMEEN